ncbi:MAG: magnesium transporter [Nocardiopsaceae bacterium]|nr:magnesium transporter [Nocardiopsaceae bacterium]
MSTSATPAGRGAVTGRQVFTSRLRGRPFLDGDGRVIGRVRDVVLLPAAGDEPPQALGLVVQLRRRQIFVGFGRIGEIGADGAHLIGGTVDLGGFTLRPGELLASGLYGRQVKARAVADVAISPSETRRSGWEVSALALREQRGLRRHAPAIVPWHDCRELFDVAPETGHLAGLREMAPADLASAVEEMPVGRRSELAAALDDAELADLLEELPEADQVRLLDSLELERSADVVEEMQPDDAADLLAEMPADKRERLLTAMASVQAADLRRLLRYDGATAGGIMTSQPLIFTPDKTVAEVLARVRNPDESQITAAQVFVCEPPDQTPTGLYLGSVGFQRLLRRPPAVAIGECIQSRVYVRPDLPQRDLAVQLAAYNMVSVAVCDSAGRLLGAATVDDVLDKTLPADWRRKERR